ncbi:MAG: dTDP-4-dehydrorhamnose reductase [Bacteroidales bacterium]|nr:dTDP-4-dehydrorhamnose reductase [Bacteroidales bacterium]
MAKILITGANGQLGNEMRCVATNDTNNNYVFTDVADLDITDTNSVSSFFKEINPDFVVNCAAYTAVDKAEDEIEVCSLINSKAVENIATAAKDIDCKVIHISTDYVYDGNATKPYNENDITSPKSVYGKTKLKGEEAILTILPNSGIVIRTAWLYSTYGKNFVKTMIDLGKVRDSLNVVNDQKGTPTYAADLALAINQIINTPTFIPGIYNYSNEGECSWYEFACLIHELAEVKCKINPIPTEQYPTKATRPKYSVLNKNKIKETYGITIPNWEESLKKCIDILNKNNI